MKHLFTLLFALLSLCLSAQSISGRVVGNDGKFIEFATVTLHQLSDSLLVKGEITGENGNFTLEMAEAGNYYMECAYIGYETYRSKPINLNGSENYDAGKITLSAAAQVIDEVTIKAKKPLIEIQADKTVLNTDASISAVGSNGLDLLRKAPGVTVDNNENIQLKGKNGVAIYIDGKPSYLNPTELAGLLKGMTAADIEAIEIITNPSAKYDAQGNAGIINLRLRKNKNFGTNGSLNVSAGYGKYHKSNMGLNLNNRNQKVNTFGSIGLGNNKSYNELNLYREQEGGVFDQKQSQVNLNKPINTKLGIDYYASSKHTFGFLINANTQYGDNTFISTSETRISSLSNPDKVDSILRAGNNITKTSLNANANLNYRFTDTLGNEVSIDLDRGMYSSDATSMQPNRYFSGETGQVTTRRDFTNETPSSIHITTAKLDYTKNFKKSGLRLGAGGKYARVKTDNTFSFFNLIDGSQVKDIYQSNSFSYTEEVSALYLNLAGGKGKFNYQAGIRMENTHSIGDLTRDTSLEMRPQDYVDRNYTDFFPSAALTYNASQSHTFNLTYSRRIDRPNYEDLNPFEWRLDELTFRKGNPFLKPQYNNNIELSYTLKQTATFGISYSNSKDVVTDIVESDPLEPNKSFINYRNLASQEQFAFTFNSPLPIKEWWNGYLSATVYKSYYKARFPEYNFDVATPIATNIYMENNFTLPNDYTFEVSGWFNSASIWGGSWLTEPQGSLDLGLKKMILNGKGSLKIGVTDILHTAPWSSYSDAIPGLKIRGSGLWESQRVNVNFNYRFGSSDVKSARRRSTGLEDENKRIKS
ncbi:MAG: TonB-dependent receptor [Saprospiraceae bacterium]|nr:TonB-dependent receptor [Saprospiraceae bacterium]